MATVAGVLGRRWWLLLLPLLVLFGLALIVLAGRSTSYEAVATIRTDANAALAGAGATDAGDRARDLLTEARLLARSPAFLEEVAERSGLEGDGRVRRLAEDLEVRPAGEALVQIAFTAGDADQARLVAASAAELVLRSRRARVAEGGEEAVGLLAERLEAAEEAAVEASAALAAFDRRNPQPAPGDPPLPRAVESESDRLAAEAAAAREAVATARSQLEEARFAAEVELARTRGEQLVDRPLEPAGDDGSLWPLVVLVMVVGLAVGAALAVAAERRDHTVRDEIDVQEAAPGVPVLAVVDGS